MKRTWMFHLVGKPMRRNIFRERFLLIYMKTFLRQDQNLSFTHPSREKFINNISELGVGEGTYVVVYDQGITDDDSVAVSYWASRLAWQLRYEGFDRVAVLDGGFVKWLEEGRPTTSQSNSYPQGNFVGVRKPELFVGRKRMYGKH